LRLYQYRENRINHRPFRHPAAGGAYVKQSL